MRITTKGQVTIPNFYRIKYGLLPHMEVTFKEQGNLLCLVKAKQSKKTSRGEQIIRRMRSVQTNNMTTEEVMELTRGYSQDDK